MLNRLIGIICLTAMLLANTAVVVRDVLPRWIANDVPPSDGELLQREERRCAQVAICDGDGRRVGSSWTVARCNMFGIVTVQATTVLNGLPLPGGLTAPSVMVDTELTYRQDERLVDELSFRLHGLGFAVVLEGEAMPTGEFACKWRIGEQRGAFLLDARAPAALGDVIRPFDRLPELRVGQTWRVRLLDPLSQVLDRGTVATAGLELEPIIIRVTGRERITHQGQELEAFVVQADNGQACAYAAPDGRVLRQIVNVPLLGRLVLDDEPFDENLLRHQRDLFRRRQGLLDQASGGESRNGDAEHPQP